MLFFYRDSEYSLVLYDRINVIIIILYYIIKILLFFFKVKIIFCFNLMIYVGLFSNVIIVLRKCRNKFLVFVYILYIFSLWGI